MGGVSYTLSFFISNITFMAKKCFICGKDAEFCIKNSSDYYCEKCASEQFGDLSYLQRVGEKARKLRKFLSEKDPPIYES